MTDLESRVRDALRTDEIGWDDLRRPTLRAEATRPPRRWPAVLATAAAVAVVATVAAVIATTRTGTSNAPAGSQAAYAGYAWQLTGLADRHGYVDVASVPAQIAYSDHAVSGTLAGASIFGHYRATSDGYQLSDIGFAGTAGRIADSSERRISSAFAGVFVHVSGIRDVDPDRPATVVATVNGNRLVLHANGVTLQLSRIGPSGLSPIIDAVGYTWRGVSLRDARGQLAIPSQLVAKIGFDKLGQLVASANDSPITGRFGLTGTGYVVGDTTTRGSGFAYVERTQLRVMRAVDAMVASNAQVTATVDGNTLTLQRNGITLVLQRGQPEPAYQFTIGGSATATSASATPITEPGTGPGNSVAVTP